MYRRADFWEIMRHSLRIYPTPVIVEVGNTDSTLVGLDLSNPISKAIMYLGDDDTYWANQYLFYAIASLSMYPKEDLKVTIISDDYLHWSHLIQMEQYDFVFFNSAKFAINKILSVLDIKKTGKNNSMHRQTNVLVLEDYQQIYEEIHELLEPLLIYGAYYNIWVFTSSVFKYPYFKTIFNCTENGQMNLIKGYDEGFITKIITDLGGENE